MISKIRNYFLTGLIVILPLVVTFYVLLVLFEFFDGFLRPLEKMVLGYYVPGLSLVVTFLVIVLVGVLATVALGRKMFQVFEDSLLRIPIVRSIYSITKQASETFLAPKGTEFKGVVLVEFPRKGMYTIGFNTGITVGEIQDKTREKVINVYVPTSPNPTSGYYLVVPEKDLIYLDMSMDTAMKLIISGGFTK